MASTKLYVNDPWASPMPLAHAIQLKCGSNVGKHRMTSPASIRRPYTAPDLHPAPPRKKYNSPRSPPSSPPPTDRIPIAPPTSQRPKTPPYYQRPVTPPWYRVTAIRRPATADDTKTSLAQERQRDAMLQLALKNELIRGNRKTYDQLRSHNTRLRQNAANQRRELHRYLHRRNHDTTGYTPRVYSSHGDRRPVSVQSISSAGDLVTETGSNCPTRRLQGYTQKAWMNESRVTSEHDVPQISETEDKSSSVCIRDTAGRVSRSPLAMGDVNSTMTPRPSDARSIMSSAAESYKSAIMFNDPVRHPKCQLCNRQFIAKRNYTKSCRHHKGPFVPTCNSCGRLYGQEGCELGPHIASVVPTRPT